MKRFSSAFVLGIFFLSSHFSQAETASPMAVLKVKRVYEVTIENNECMDTFKQVTHDSPQQALDGVESSCKEKLYPAVRASIGTSGLIFLGLTYNKKSHSDFTIGPAASISAGASIALLRPDLETSAQAQDKDLYKLWLPRNKMRFYIDLVVAYNAALNGLFHPLRDDGTETKMDFGVIPVSLLSSLDLGWVKFKQNGGGIETRITFTLGLITGWLYNKDTDTHNLIFGAQPGITWQF